MSDDLNDFVSVLVPKQHLTEVYGFIASLEQPSSGRETAGVSNGDASDWSTDLVARQFRESPESMKRFQRHLADHAGEEFSTREIAEAIGAERGWNTVAGALGAYGRRVKNRYKRNSFPFQSRWDYGIGQACHSMTPEVAEIIKSL